MFLPTGFGKSVCYQVLPFVFDHKLGLVVESSIIVVSPLIALMVDQQESEAKWCWSCDYLLWFKGHHCGQGVHCY